MSEYNDPNYNQDFSQGYTDQGGYGDFSQGYDFSAGYEQQPASGDDVVYGDEGPTTGTSGDEAYAQGYDQQPGYDQQAYDQAGYDQQQGYDQAGYDQQQGYDQAGYDQQAYDQTGYDQQAYDQAGYDQQQGYDQAGYDQAGYDQGYGDYSQGYDQGYEQGYEQEAAAEDDVVAEDEEQEAGAGAGNKRKLLMMAGIGLAVLVGLGGAGAYMLTMGGEEGGEGPGFDIASITRMIPFLGPKDSEETVTALQDNAALVKRAIDAYAREQGKLPPTSSAVMAQLRKMKQSLSNPYQPEEPVLVETGDAPTAPAAIAYAVSGKRYTLVVGDITGAPLAIEGQPFELTGRLSNQAKPVKQAAKPTTAAKPGKPGEKPAKAAQTAEATPEPMAKPNGAAKTAKKKDELEDFLKARTEKQDDETSVGKVVPSEVLVRRNQEFDRWRSKGIALVYEQRTAESIAAFKRALALRPGDPSVTRWLATIQGVIDKHTLEERDRWEKEKAEALKKNEPPPTPIRVGGPNLAPPAPPGGPAGGDDAMKMYRELQKQDKAPLLAPPKLED